MVLSNAERQERYRRRLKAAARGEDLAERARALIDQALDVIWALDGENIGLDRDVDSVDALKALLVAPAYLRANRTTTVAELAELSAAYVENEKATPDQREILARAAALFDAVSLRHVEPAEAPARPKRGRAD